MPAYNEPSILAVARYQPLDVDLTAIAALVTTAYGRAFLTLGNAAAARTYVGLDATAAAQFDTVAIHDTDDSHFLRLLAGSNLTADRDLTLTTGDAARTITLSGDPTLADWFDQSVKVAATPRFARIGLGAAADGTAAFNLSGTMRFQDAFKQIVNNQSGVGFLFQGGGTTFFECTSQGFVVSAPAFTMQDVPVSLGSFNSQTASFRPIYSGTLGAGNTQILARFWPTNSGLTNNGTIWGFSADVSGVTGAKYAAIFEGGPVSIEHDVGVRLGSTVTAPVAPAQALDVNGNVRVGAVSGAAGSRIIGRGEHTSAPAATLATGEWELSLYDNGVVPVLRVRYNDAGSTKTFDVGPLV